MDMSNPFERAVHPKQYDSDDLSWSKEAAAESGRTQFYSEYLDPYLKTWKGKDFLDIGAGTGWLVQKAANEGAASALGIEPSQRNLEIAKNHHPGVEVVQCSFEDFDPEGKRFDEITAVMSFSHIADLRRAFQKLRSMLSERGEVIIIVPDFQYCRMPRHGYTLNIQEMNDDEYAVSVNRQSGLIADIVRKTAVYEKTAAEVGLRLVEDKGMPPTEAQIARSPRYAEVREYAISRLLRFLPQEMSNDVK